MPTENINIETQVQVDITRAALQALIAANTVKKKLYHVTDAIGGTQKILVWSLTNSTTSFNAVNFTNGKFGKYYIGPDVFVAIVEGMGGVLSYNSLAVFPTTGLQNTVYIDLATNEQYYWNGSSYELLSGGNVYEPTVDDFPTIGSADTLYVATETGVMYLWDTTDEVYVALSDNGNYIPLAGTASGSPVTGTIEVSDGVEFYENFGDLKHAIFFTDILRIGSDDVVTGDFCHIDFSTQYGSIDGNPTNFRGLVYNGDFSANFELQSLIDLRTMKSRIWTKAGTPTTTDDSAAGYLVGSLIWDITNSILYRCTSNTAGAATWVKAVPSLSDLWRHVITTDSASFSGTTSETIVQSVLVPAGTFNGDWDVLVRARVRKTGTVGSTGMRFRINTSNSLVGASTLGLLNAGSTNIYLQMKRDVIIKGSNTEVFSNTTSTATDDLNSNVAVTLLSINWAVDQYIMVTVTPTSTGDSYINSFLLVEGRKTLS